MAARVYRPGFRFYFVLALLSGFVPAFALFAGAPLPEAGRLWSWILVGYVVVALIGNAFVSYRVDERGVTRTRFGKREFFAWENMRAVTEVESPPGYRRTYRTPHWEVTGRKARVLFRFGIMLGRREQFIADIESELLKHRQERIDQARAKADG